MHKEKDIVYVKFLSESKDGAFYYESFDKDVKILISRKLVDSQNLEKDKNIWVSIKEYNTDKSSQVYILQKNPAYIGSEFNKLVEQYNVGDIYTFPIVEVNKTYIVVEIGVNVTLRIDIEKNALNKKYTEVGDREFEIIESRKDTNGKCIINIAPYDKYNNKLWDELPTSINDIKMLDNVSANMDTEILDKLSAEHSNKEIKQKLNDVYVSKYNAKDIDISKRDGVCIAEFSLDIKNNRGVPQLVGLKRRSGDKWVINSVTSINAEKVMERDIYIPDWDKVLDTLREMALKGERWDRILPNGGIEKNFVLKQYLRFGYYKLWLDDGIHYENGEAIFNTGLVDDTYDPIYCYLKPNTYKDFYEKKWKIEYFACVGKDRNGKELNAKFTKFPDAAKYINIDNMQELYFDTRKELRCDYIHIINDNIDRLPFEFVKNRVIFDEQAREYIESYESGDKSSKKKLYEYIVNDADPELTRILQSGLEDAVKTAVKFCEWNYKTAVPMYYPRSNGISLLLPLKLNKKSDSMADVALVVQRLDNGNYQGQTILTMEMAYQDARQICRPNSDWLL